VESGERARGPYKTVTGVFVREQGERGIKKKKKMRAVKGKHSGDCGPGDLGRGRVWTRGGKIGTERGAAGQWETKN